MTIPEGLLEELIDGAKVRGASAADAIAVDQVSTVVRVRQAAVERVEQAREKVVGLRVFFGTRSAVAATSDVTPGGVQHLCDVTCKNARVTAEDPAAGLPDPAEMGEPTADLDLHDAGADAFDVDEAIARARTAEATALAHHKDIKQVESSQFSFADSVIRFGTSLGFSGVYRGTRYGLYTVPIASRDGAMVRDYWSTSRRHLADLDSPEEVGRVAAERTMRRVGARQVATATVPVVFDPETASSLVAHISSAANGYSIYRGSSFLLDKLGERIASPLVTVVDDATVPRGLGTKPFDGEGLPTRRTLVVKEGELQSYLLDSYSARKLGLASTHNAARSPADSPSVAPSNLRLLPGDRTPEQIIGGIRSGFYVTELFGFGVNAVTGDYSQGAAGLWIEDGELAYPVHEITIAGNLGDMLAGIEEVGDDLRDDRRVSSPTLKIASMTVAGS